MSEKDLIELENESGEEAGKKRFNLCKNSQAKCCPKYCQSLTKLLQFLT